MNVSLQVSGALSVAILGAVSSSYTASLVAQGNSIRDALDGGYRLAFIIALTSVALGIALGLVILKRPSAPAQGQGVVEFEEAESETMIAEVV